jgi:hypothetical protein
VSISRVSQYIIETGEYLAIGNWLYNNFDDVSGVSFLPYSDHTYEQAPYEADYGRAVPTS